MSVSRQLRSFILPIFAAGIVPCFLVVQINPPGVKIYLPLPYLQVPLGLCFMGLGLYVLITTIRLFASIGKGTLAPWDPTQQLVTQGVYGYTRNPMISGVLFTLAGEAILFGSGAIGLWALMFFAINTIYFKLFEEPWLVRRFGQEYLIYRANVPMWLPRLKPWQAKKEDGQK